MEQKTDVHCNYHVPTMMKFQYNLIAHINETANFETNDLKPIEEFPFALLCQMCWSKNVLEEDDAPDQILLGTMDTNFCILLALSIYLKAWMEHGNGVHSHFMFSDAMDDGMPTWVKDNVHGILKNVLVAMNFEPSN